LNLLPSITSEIEFEVIIASTVGFSFLFLSNHITEIKIIDIITTNIPTTSILLV